MPTVCCLLCHIPAGLKDWEKRLIISDRAHLGKLPMGPWGWPLLALSIVQSSGDPGAPTWHHRLLSLTLFNEPQGSS